MAPSGEVNFDLPDGNLLAITSIAVSYRLTDRIDVSVGYAHLAGGELEGLDQPKITVVDDLAGSHNVTRHSRLNGDGVRLGASASLHLKTGAEYLVSRRVSAFLYAGAFYMPPFTPAYFESAGKIQDNTGDTYDSATIDRNGTWDEYQSFNFSRFSDGSRVTYGGFGVSAELGLAIHF